MHGNVGISCLGWDFMMPRGDWGAGDAVYTALTITRSPASFADYWGCPSMQSAGSTFT